MNSKRFSGVLAPVITPFQEDLNPDAKRLIAHCKWLVSQGVGLAVFGTNSEANSLSIEEKIALLEQLVDNGVDPALMMPGTGSCALSDCARLTAHAVGLGCGGSLMLPPFYYKPVSDDGLFAFYAEVIERVASPELKIYLYHIPAFTGVPISVDLIDRLVKAYPETIVGIKDSSGDWANTKSYNDGGWSDFRVFCGSESLLLQNMQNGGSGCISATANVNPRAIKALFDSWQGSDAEQMQQQLNPVRNIFQTFPMIPALKATTAVYSGDSNWLRVRPPIVAMSDDQVGAMQSQLEELGFEMPELSRRDH